MKRSRYTEEQITYALRQAESGMPVSDVCPQMGIAEATFYVWQRKYAKLRVTELRAGKLTDLFLNFEFHALARSVRHNQVRSLTVSPTSISNEATNDVQPVWWLAPRPAPVSPLKYSWNGM